jgi:spore coat polysaccharide biosynthesis protein SpsF
VSAKVTIIVQARMGSRRLPGKVMQEICGKPGLHYVLTRCAMVPSAGLVVCAVPDEPSSSALEAVAAGCGAAIFRGSETDVLDRYFGAARAFKSDIIMRVTSDCPLIDPDVCERVIGAREEAGVDYAANNLDRTFPHGLDCEAFTFAALERAASIATDPYDREHVTPWLRRDQSVQRASIRSNNPNLARYRWTLDYPEDLEFFRALFSSMPTADHARMADIVEFLDRHPEIVNINAGRRQ